MEITCPHCKGSIDGEGFEAGGLIMCPHCQGVVAMMGDDKASSSPGIIPSSAAMTQPEELPGKLKALGIVAIIIGGLMSLCWCCLSTSIGAFNIMGPSLFTATGQEIPAEFYELAEVGLLFALCRFVLGGWVLAVGIGLLQRKVWARRGFWIAGIVWLVLSVLEAWQMGIFNEMNWGEVLQENIIMVSFFLLGSGYLVGQEAKEEFGVD